jgi:hypothetical protein
MHITEVVEQSDDHAVDVLFAAIGREALLIFLRRLIRAGHAHRDFAGQAFSPGSIDCVVDVA